MNDNYLKNPYRNDTISFSCVVLCAIFAAVLGILPMLPSGLTMVFRPIFIFFGFFALQRGGYPLGANKWLIVTVIYYSFVFLFNLITNSAVMAYVSIVLFAVFAIFATSTRWNRREIALILLTVALACDFQAILALVSNSDILMRGTQRVNFLNTTMNRNTVAFGIAPGIISNMFIFLYGGRRSGLKLCSFMGMALCGFVVFALACRSAFFASAGGCLLILWQKIREDSSSNNKLIKRLLLITTIVAVIFAAASFTEGTTAARLFDLDVKDSGRDTLWEAAWALIDEKPIFGGGYDYWDLSGQTLGTHNSFLTFMLYGGWVGGILLGFFFLMLLLETLKSKNLIPLAFLLEMLAHSWTEPGMDYYAYIPMVLALILTRYLKATNKKELFIF